MHKNQNNKFKYVSFYKWSNIMKNVLYERYRRLVLFDIENRRGLLQNKILS